MCRHENMLASFPSFQLFCQLSFMPAKKVGSLRMKLVICLDPVRVFPSISGIKVITRKRPRNEKSPPLTNGFLKRIVRTNS